MIWIIKIGGEKKLISSYHYHSKILFLEKIYNSFFSIIIDLIWEYEEFNDDRRELELRSEVWKSENKHYELIWIKKITTETFKIIQEKKFK